MAKATRREGVTQLSIVLSGDEPPNEFRIFTSGQVETTKGTFLFDETAAQSVMADYAAHGIDLMIDYDHASLATVALDPALAGKAAGWFNLEVRTGELWAVNVRWTEPAAEALRRKEWRFMSPAFSTDEAGRVTGLLNVAITNIPATRKLEPLMAASAITTLGAAMDPKLIAEALDALVAGDAEKCAELLKGLIASAAGAPAPAPEPTDKPKEEPAKMAEEEKPEEVMAASARLMRLSGKTSIVDAIAEVEVWRESHLKLETETQKLAQERKILEDAERRKLCVELVTLAGRAPATVWATSEKDSAPKPYLAAMPIADLRAMHADEIKANGGKRPELKPPPGGGGNVAPAGGIVVALPGGREVTLSAREVSMCTEMKIDPKDYAARKPAKKDDDR